MRGGAPRLAAASRSTVSSGRSAAAAHREPEHDARHAAAHHRDGIDECAETAPVASFQREREPESQRGAEKRDAQADFETRRDRIEIAR